MSSPMPPHPLKDPRKLTWRPRRLQKYKKKEQLKPLLDEARAFIRAAKNSSHPKLSEWHGALKDRKRLLEAGKKASKELNEAHNASGGEILRDDEALPDEVEGLEGLKGTVVGKNRDLIDDTEKEIAVILKVLVDNSSVEAVYRVFTALYDQAVVNQVKVSNTLQKGIEKLGKNTVESIIREIIPEALPTALRPGSKDFPHRLASSPAKIATPVSRRNAPVIALSSPVLPPPARYKPVLTSIKEAPRDTDQQIKDLTTAKEAAEEKMETLQAEVRFLKGTVLKTYYLDWQPEESIIREHAMTLRGLQKVDSLTTPFHLLLPARAPLVLATEFDGLSLKPTKPLSLDFLTSLCEDMVPEHLPWLQARLSKLGHASANRSAQELAVLISYLWAVMGDGFCLPSGLGRQSLFVTFANIGQRCFQFVDSDIWDHLVKLVNEGKFGWPYESWTLLDRICYAWMRSLEVQPFEIRDDLRWGEFAGLVDAIRGKQPRDFVQLLSYQEVQAFISQEDTSTVLIVGKGMAILRSKEGEHGSDVEYIWTRLIGGEVILSRRGLVFKTGGINSGYSLYFRPKISEKFDLSLSKITLESEINYFTKYYGEEIDEMMEVMKGRPEEDIYE